MLKTKKSKPGRRERELAKLIIQMPKFSTTGAAPNHTKTKVKNVKGHPIEGKVGNIYIPDQKVGEPFTAKGMKRERREAKLKNEANHHVAKKQKGESESE